MLIPFPLGLFGMAVIFDLLARFAGQESLGQASLPMIAAGIITGLLAAVFGAIDWAAIPSGTRAKGIATTHGLGNVAIVVLFAIAWWLRRETPGAASGLALLLEVVGVLGALVTGWLGGELVDRLGVGVDRGANHNAPSSLSGQPAPKGALRVAATLVPDRPMETDRAVERHRGPQLAHAAQRLPDPGFRLSRAA